MQTAQSVTPGQGQTVNIAGVEVGEIKSVKLEDGRAIIGMKIEPRYNRVYRDATILLRPKTGLKDMVAELTPGTEAAGRLPEGGRIPVSQTLPDVNLDEILAALDADTRDYLTLLLNDGGQALKGNGRELGNTIRRIEPTAKLSRRVNEALAERSANIKRAIHNFSLITEELGDKDDVVADFVVDSNAVFASLRQPGRGAARDAARAAVLAADHADHARQVAGAGRRARPDARGPAPDRPRARADPAPAAAVPAHHDADHPRRAAPVRARVAADRQGAAPGAARPRRRHPRPHEDVQEPQPPPQRARLQPARRDRGGLPVLALLGQPPGADRLRHPGRARPDPPRPRGLRLPDRRAAGLRRGGQPAARHARRPAQRAQPLRRCARASQEEGGDRWLSPLRPSGASPRW